jgi:hypothetical protein
LKKSTVSGEDAARSKSLKVEGRRSEEEEEVSGQWEEGIRDWIIRKLGLCAFPDAVGNGLFADGEFPATRRRLWLSVVAFGYAGMNCRGKWPGKAEREEVIDQRGRKWKRYSLLEI